MGLHDRRTSKTADETASFIKTPARAGAARNRLIGLYAGVTEGQVVHRRLYARHDAQCRKERIGNAG